MIKVLADVIFETTVQTTLKTPARTMVETTMDVIAEPPIGALLNSNWVVWIIAIIVGALAIGTVALILVLNKYKKR